MSDKKKMTEAEFRAASAKGKANFDSAQKGAKTRAAVKSNVAKKGSNLAALAGFAIGGPQLKGAKAAGSAIRRIAEQRASSKALKGAAAKARMEAARGKGVEYAMTGGTRINERSAMGGVIPYATRQSNTAALKSATEKQMNLTSKMTPKQREKFNRDRKLDKQERKAFEEGRRSTPKDYRKDMR